MDKKRSAASAAWTGCRTLGGTLLCALLLAPAGSALQAQTQSQAEARTDDAVLRPVIAAAQLPVEALSPVAEDGVSGEAFLRKPPGDGPFPAVILIHGGAPRWSTDMLRDYVLHTHASRFLEAGYVVVAMTRRDLDLALPFDEVQPAVRDALAVFDAVAALPYVSDVLLRGTSVGGYLALEVAAARRPAAVLVEEPFSFPFVGMSPGEGAGQAPDTRKIEALQAPLLLIRGDQTPNINEFNREVFIPAVQAAGKPLEVLSYPGGLHSFAFYDSPERTPEPALSRQAFQAMEAFFRAQLRRPPSPLEAALVSQEPIVLP